MSSAQPQIDSLELRFSAQNYEEASRRHRAEFLSAIVRTIAPLGILFIIVTNGYPLLQGDRVRNPVMFLFIPIIFVVAVLVERLSKSKYHHFTVIATLIIASVVALASAITIKHSDVNDIAYYYVSLPILLSSVFLSSRTTILITGINLVAMVVVTFAFMDATDHEAIWMGPVGYVFIISVAIILAAHYRNLIEQDNLSALSEQEARYRGLFETVFEGLMVCDGQKIVDVNHRLTRQLDYTPEELIGENVAVIVPEEAMKEITKLLTGKSLTSGEISLHKKDGTLRNVELVAQPVIMNGRMVSLIATRDITDKKAAAQQAVELARHQERVSILEEIIDHISHDFKTPLTTMNANLYLLRQLEGPPKQTKYTDALQSASDRMERIVEQILTFARLDLSIEKKIPETDIHAAIQDELARISSAVEEHKIKIEHNFGESRPKSRISTTNLHLVLANVLDNALQFSADGSKISISTAVDDQQVTITVRDAGIGIQTEHLERIFDNFYRVEKARPATGGTGLGLAIVKRIVDAHGGQIKVESQPGKGSTFRISLPLSSPIPAMPPQAD